MLHQEIELRKWQKKWFMHTLSAKDFSKNFIGLVLLIGYIFKFQSCWFRLFLILMVLSFTLLLHLWDVTHRINISFFTCSAIV